MNRSLILAILAAGAVVAGAICYSADGFTGRDHANILFLISGILGLGAIGETYGSKK